jgi:pyridinium-3,5-bisthiocarboxylic acid mononucleotide nickel chelatase
VTRTVAWFHCFSGIAGDMALGALLDAGAELAAVREALARLPVSGWSLEVESVQRCGVRSTRAVVTADESHQHRTKRHIDALLDTAALPHRVDSRARAVFALLAEVEGAIHDRPPDDVEFHEVGSLDAIVDVVGTCAALEALGIDDVAASPIATGLGTVQGAHGTLPNPAPAVVAMLARTGAPAHGVNTGVELATPTGVALLAALASVWGPLPAIRVEGAGYGAGRRDLPGRPNVTQVVVGTTITATTATPPGQPVRLLEANVDDATGETLAHAVARLLAAGAHDAWITPIVMKKGRPAYTVSALCDPAVTADVATVLVAETGSLGVRGSVIERWPQRRSETTVDVAGVDVRVKVADGRVKVEHDDAAVAAERLGLPLRDVVGRAEAAARDANR